MTRDVTVRLSATVQEYLTAMQQAEQATTRVADAADRLGDISISADSSVAADLDQAASASDSAASSMEGAAGAAEGMSGGMESAGASAESVSAGMDSAGASAESASAGLDSAGASAQVFSSNLDGSGASAQSFAASLDTVGAQSQSVSGDMQSISGAAASAAAEFQSLGGVAGGLSGNLDGLASSFASTMSFSEGMGGFLLGLGNRATEAQGHLSTFGQTMGSIAGESRAFGLGLAAIGGGLTAMLGSVIQTGIAYNTLQQVAGRALETTAGSAEAAADQMQRLHAFADESPFARDTWITAQQQLMAFGMEAERVVPTLEGVQNAVAAIGGGDNEIMQLVDILGQVEGQGRITGRELQRLGQMGINAADLIGDAMGVSGNEIRTQITAGALDAETAITALTEGMMTRFDGAAEGLRDTMEGALDRIRARIRDIGSVLATPLVDPSGGGFLVEAINQAADFGSALLDLPPVVLQTGAAFAGLAGLVMAAGGAWALAGTQITAFATGAWNAITATAGLGRSLFATAGGLRTLAVGAGIAIAAVAGLAILNAISDDSEDVAASVQRMTQELIKAADGATAFENIQWTRAADGKDHIEDLSAALERLQADGIQGFNDSMNRFFGQFPGINSAINDLDLNIENLGESMSQAFDEGKFDQAAAGMRELVAAGMDAEQLGELFPDYAERLTTIAAEAGHAASLQDILNVAVNDAALAALFAGESWETVSRLVEQGADAVYDAEGAFDSSASAADRARDAYSRMGEAAEEAASGISSLVDDMNAFANISRDAQQVELDWIASQQELQAAFDETGGTLNRYTAEGQENRELLLGMAGDTLEAAAAQVTLGGSVEDARSILEQGMGAIEQFGEAAGMSSTEVEQLVRDMYEIPPEVPIDVWVEDQATDVFNEVNSIIDETPDQFQIRLEGQDRNVQDLINAFVNADQETIIDILGDSAYAEEALAALQAGDYRLVAEIMAEKEQAEAALNALIEGDYVTWVDIIGNAEDADAALAALQQGDYEAFVDFIGDDTMAMEIWNGMMGFFDGAPPAIIDMDGDPSGAESDLNAIVNGDHLAIIQLMGDDSDAAGVINALIGGDYNTLVDILGDDSLARQVMNAFTSGDYQAVADLLANDSSARQTVGTFTATQWQTFIEAIANTGSANAALNALTRSRTAMINVVTSGVGAARSAVSRAAANARARVGLARGGIAPAATGLAGYSTGGRLPHTGLGTDMILGVNGAGMPVARVDDGEFVTNRASTRRHESLLWAVNNDDLFGMRRYLERLPAHAGGGHAGYTGPVREFAQPRQTGFDYNRLAHAMSSRDGGDGGTVQFNITTNNPVAEKTSASVSAGLEAIGAGYMPSEVNHV